METPKLWFDSEGDYLGVVFDLTMCPPPSASLVTACRPTPEVDPETTHTLPAIDAVVVLWVARLFARNMSSSGSRRFATDASL